MLPFMLVIDTSQQCAYVLLHTTSQVITAATAHYYL
jgi:hypothetical protein